MTLEESKLDNHPICPPPHIPTEQEHRIAWLTYCLERITDELMGVWLVRNGGIKNTTEDFYLKPLLKGLFDGYDDVDCWEKLHPYELFKKSYGADLASMHNGDCVACAITCSRCYAETLYKLDSTITWSGKSEGWALYHEYRGLVEDATNQG